VLLEELAGGRGLVDIALLDGDAVLGQETPGVLAGGSGRLAVEQGLGHAAPPGRALVVESTVPGGAPGAVMLTINEIFYSIQGESTYSGRPCVFVRLTACDLRCAWCDTPYSFTEGRKMPLDAVLAEINRHPCDLVEVTGGEPLLQPGVYPLMEALLARGKTVLLETGGHLPLDRVPAPVVKIVDVKCPGSGESRRNHWANLELVGSQDEVKFVIADRADYEFARDVLRSWNLAARVHAVLFSPVHGALAPLPLAQWILADALPVRLQLQVHKYIWGAEVRGV
jgi:7-carboxy-7-deazaguanine synthase